MKKTALVLGATGLVGEQVVGQLIASENYDKVIALVRKPLSFTHAKLITVITDFSNLESVNADLKAHDVFCCMGTTIAKAGSQAAFKRVDLDIPKQVAQLCLGNGAKSFILCSSLGADAKSGVFYSRIKGELEKAVSEMGFEAVKIFRPSILLGDRKEKRTGEAIGRFVAERFSFLFAGPFRKYAGTPVSLLAKKMVAAANNDRKGVTIYENEAILAGN